MDIKAILCKWLSYLLIPYSFHRFGISIHKADGLYEIYNNEILVTYTSVKPRRRAAILCMSEYKWVQRFLAE